MPSGVRLRDVGRTDIQLQKGTFSEQIEPDLDIRMEAGG
jgi:hypothetical protein